MGEREQEILNHGHGDCHGQTTSHAHEAGLRAGCPPVTCRRDTRSSITAAAPRLRQ